MNINIDELYQQYKNNNPVIPFSHKVIDFLINAGYITVLFRKPGLFLSLMKNMLLTKLLRVKNTTFRTVTFSLDYRCNYNCSHCNIALMERDDKEKMQPSDYKRVDMDLSKLGVLSYAFTGGEPLMFKKQLFEILSLLDVKKKLVLIQTNASILDEKLAVQLQRAGVDVLAISMDKMHSINRTKKDEIDFEWYDRILEIIKKSKLQLHLLYVVDKENLKNGEFEKVMNYCFKNKVLLIFNPTVPEGNWKDREDVLISEDDSNFVRFIEKNTPYARTDIKSNLKGYGCPAFKEKLYITPYGDVQGCTFLQFSIGNVKTENIGEILKRVSKLPYFSKYHGMCPAAEDREFIKQYSDAMSKTDKYPLELENYVEVLNTGIR